MTELNKLKAEVDQLKTEFNGAKEKFFENVEDIPEWARPSVEKLMKKGILKGDGQGLDLSYTLLRIIVINDRAGVYGA